MPQRQRTWIQVGYWLFFLAGGLTLGLVTAGRPSFYRDGSSGWWLLWWLRVEVPLAISALVATLSVGPLLGCHARIRHWRRRRRMRSSQLPR